MRAKRAAPLAAIALVGAGAWAGGTGANVGTVAAVLGMIGGVGRGLVEHPRTVLRTSWPLFAAAPFVGLLASALLTLVGIAIASWVFGIPGTQSWAELAIWTNAATLGIGLAKSCVFPVVVLPVLVLGARPLARPEPVGLRVHPVRRRVADVCRGNFRHDGDESGAAAAAPTLPAGTGPRGED